MMLNLPLFLITRETEGFQLAVSLEVTIPSFEYGTNLWMQHLVLVCTEGLSPDILHDVVKMFGSSSMPDTSGLLLGHVSSCRCVRARWSQGQSQSIYDNFPLLLKTTLLNKITHERQKHKDACGLACSSSLQHPLDMCDRTYHGVEALSDSPLQSKYVFFGVKLWVVEWFGMDHFLSFLSDLVIESFVHTRLSRNDQSLSTSIQELASHKERHIVLPIYLLGLGLTQSNCYQNWSTTPKTCTDNQLERFAQLSEYHFHWSREIDIPKKWRK